MPANATDRRPYRLQLACMLLGIIGLVAYAVSKFTPGRVVILITVAGIVGFAISLIILIRSARRFGPIVVTVAGSVLAVALGTYLVLFPLIYFFQDTIANRMNAFFVPRGISAQAAQALVSGGVEPIDLATPDGAVLGVWLVRNSGTARSPLLIFFDGSGSEAWAMVSYARKLAGWSVALVNYRGFGPSTGTPSQANAFADAILIYDALLRRPDVNPGQVVAMGYSLGTGVAVYLSAERPLAGTVLVSPYDSMTLVGLKQPFLYAPLSGIMKRYFDSISRAPGIRSPLLCLIGSADPVVSPALSLKLAGSWGGETVVKSYAGEDHGLLLHGNSSWTDIAAFLHRFE